MAESRAVHASQQASGYDVGGAFIERVYGDNIHYGYWDAGRPAGTFSEAQDRLTDVLGQRALAGPGRRVLDVGCGTGGTARRLHRQTGAEVTGVSLSGWEVDLARRKAAADGVAAGLRFERADAVDLPFADDTFDAALIVEVLVHVSDKPAALAEVRRVLRPGGRLICAEPVKVRPMTALQTLTWHSMGLATVSDEASYRDALTTSGLVVEDVEDATANIRPSFAAIRQAVQEEARRLQELHSGPELTEVRRMMLEAQEIVRRTHGYRIFVASVLSTDKARQHEQRHPSHGLVESRMG